MFWAVSHVHIEIMYVIAFFITYEAMINRLLSIFECQNKLAMLLHKNFI